ncbi:hypothetical protein PENSPDRAFT_659373 [Peniophora sp. CONT]|nr:hypothetical protein PENSPDRAFT_659373 [Peniophora sp. CONT]
MTRSRVPASNPDSTRAASCDPTTTNNDNTATNDGATTSATTSTRKNKKRQRRGSISDSEDDHQRRVKQHRSRAPSPPSLPPSQNAAESGHLPPPDLPRTSRTLVAAIVNANDPTYSQSSTVINQHAPSTLTSAASSARGQATTVNPNSPFSAGDLELLDRAAALLTRVLAVARTAEHPVVGRNNSSGGSDHTNELDSAAIHGEKSSMDVYGRSQDDKARLGTSQPSAPDTSRASDLARHRRATPRNDNASSPIRAPSNVGGDEGPEFNARRSRMFLQSLGASYRVNGNSLTRTMGAGMNAPQTPLILRNPSTIVPHTPRAESWTDAVTSIYGPGSETRGLTKASSRICLLAFDRG